jgi:hypothetical protein
MGRSLLLPAVLVLLLLGSTHQNDDAKATELHQRLINVSGARHRRGHDATVRVLRLRPAELREPQPLAGAATALFEGGMEERRAAEQGAGRGAQVRGAQEAPQLVRPQLRWSAGSQAGAAGGGDGGPLLCPKLLLQLRLPQAAGSRPINQLLLVSWEHTQAADVADVRLWLQELHAARLPPGGRRRRRRLRGRQRRGAACAPGHAQAAALLLRRRAAWTAISHQPQGQQPTRPAPCPAGQPAAHQLQRGGLAGRHGAHAGRRAGRSDGGWRAGAAAAGGMQHPPGPRHPARRQQRPGWSPPAAAAAAARSDRPPPAPRPRCPAAS